MKVVLNASGGGSDNGISANGIVEKDITLEIAKIIKDEIEKNGIEVFMLRDSDITISYEDRIKKLNKEYPKGEDVIIISNTLMSGGSSGIEIIYPLASDDSLANSLSNSLSYFNDVKYYQYRWPTDTSKDYYYIMRATPRFETIIIRYGHADNIDDANIIKNKYRDMALAVADTLLEYILGKNTYVVKSGDTLYSIAKKYGVSVNDLKSINNKIDDNLSVGTILKIPTVKVSQENVSDKYTYVVKSGDTLYSIAKKYNTSVQKLKDINNKSNNNLSIGEKLNLYVKYKIKSGDTLYNIAKKNNTSVDKIKDLNNLKNNILTIGNYIYLP